MHKLNKNVLVYSATVDKPFPLLHLLLLKFHTFMVTLRRIQETFETCVEMEDFVVIGCNLLNARILASEPCIQIADKQDES